MIASDVELGSDVSIPQPALVNLYGCKVGDHTRIGAFVEVQRGAAIGRHCKISSHTFVCAGVTIGDAVFIGHGVMPCDLEAIVPIARALGLALIEDAACAAGSEILWNGEWQRIGRPHGDIACFSFHPRKVLTTGDGGMS